MTRYCISFGEGTTLYDKFSYPAGEMQIRFKPTETEILRRSTEVRVTARITKPRHLVELVLLGSAIDGVAPDATKVLVVPYLPYSRADRRFVAGDCNGLFSFYKIAVEAAGFDKVVTLDAHNATAWPNPTLVDVSAKPLITNAIMKFGLMHGTRDVCLLFPDEGARRRYQFDPKIIEVAHCTKQRDPVTGKLLGFEVPVKDIKANHVLIVDDICDGGGTFLGIAQEFAKTLVKKELGLYVTHGIFSAGLDNLTKAFSRIYTTNSFPQGRDVHVFDIDSMLGRIKV